MNKMKNVYFVILAGGQGQRLWPLSRKSLPKPLIPFLGEKTLLEQTIDRIDNFVSSKQNIIVVTAQEQFSLIKKVVGSKVGHILAEPEGRNTAPAILLSCFKIKEVADEDSVVVVLSADHFIPEKDKFQFYLRSAIEYAEQKNKLAVFGLKPRFAATGYGYIQAELKEKDDYFDCYKVLKFHEKPTQDVADLYIECNCMFWNIGMFVANLKTFLSEFEYCQPGLVREMQQYLATGQGYENLTNISVDYAVLEKSSNVIVFPADFEWHDIGNLNVFLSLQEKHFSKVNNVLDIESSNNIVSTQKKLAVLIGVENICVVEMDDVLVVAKRDEIEKIKTVVNLLTEKSMKELL